eukprot:1075094-Amphidinium_carterae.1
MSLGVLVRCFLHITQIPTDVKTRRQVRITTSADKHCKDFGRWHCRKKTWLLYSHVPGAAQQTVVLSHKPQYFPRRHVL